MKLADELADHGTAYTYGLGGVRIARARSCAYLSGAPLGAR